MLLNYVQAIFALAVTLGLVFAAAYAARRWAPAGLLTGRPKALRRLELVESLALGAQHRLVLVRTDGEERLILIGEGSLDPRQTSK
jgi:flagellar protein FliO/FliZ